MNRILFAVKSCESDRAAGMHECIRQTWKKDVTSTGNDTIFFMGRGSTVERIDEVRLDVGDDYHSLPYKTRGILKWMLKYNYDFIFLCDTDTYVRANKIKICGFENYDYVGVNSREWGKTFAYDAPNRDHVNYHISRCWPWCSGGFGYFLSRKAAEIIVLEEPKIWAEDMHVGQVLGPLIAKREIKAANLLQGDVGWHYTRTQENWNYHPSLGWMESMHQKYGS
jgi:Galactosyltransferase